MILQLNPPLPMHTPKGHGYAHLVTDYSMEEDLIWTVFLDSGEIWSYRNREVRAVNNITFNRITEMR